MNMINYAGRTLAKTLRPTLADDGRCSSVVHARTVEYAQKSTAAAVDYYYCCTSER